ncbi:hypothetical protein RIF29_41173 [Crotalaria pallida]|uniref:Uncharacterized protein n=1 Tax=Crotalaria pallida TaxID=3830 RepID=A0AAN9E4W4_CROPI
MSKISAYYRNSSRCSESSSAKGRGLDLKKKIHYDFSLPKNIEFVNEEEVDSSLPKFVELPRLNEDFPLPKNIEYYCDDDEYFSSSIKNKGKEVYHPLIAPGPKNGYASSSRTVMATVIGGDGESTMSMLCTMINEERIEQRLRRGEHLLLPWFAATVTKAEDSEGREPAMNMRGEDGSRARDDDDGTAARAREEEDCAVAGREDDVIATAREENCSV